MRARHTAAALVLALALGGCASMTDTERRAAGGAHVGSDPSGTDGVDEDPGASSSVARTRVIAFTAVLQTR